MKNIVSGGFATMNPDSTLNINAVEAFPVEEFSAEAQRLSNSAATEEEKLAAKIEVEVLESLQAAILAK
ncbi:delta subunit of the central stalk of mitochondrial F1F0 ATP synthase, atp16 [Linnemannia elongata]|nr:delta subunit of the central stalk of mitochondrial F1F0 ATP synthase, atp16 [Linnemannia elongata]